MRQILRLGDNYILNYEEWFGYGLNGGFCVNRKYLQKDV
jgi:hypothetical protein